MIVTPIEAGESNKSKTWIAVACFALAVGLNVAGFPIAIAFLSERLPWSCKVLAIDEAYRSVDWKVVFFLAGLIPLDLAERTGAKIYVPKSGHCKFDHVPVSEGDPIDIEDMRLDILETPGHTPEHIVYTVTDNTRGSQCWHLSESKSHSAARTTG